MELIVGFEGGVKKSAIANLCKAGPAGMQVGEQREMGKGL